MASNSRATHVVVWEWEFSFDLWLPYEVEAVHLIEHAHRSKKRHVKLSGRLACYKLDLSAKMQTRTDTGTLRQIRRSVYPIDSLPDKGSILWEWESDFGWLPYSLSTACILESAHKRNDPSVDLSKTELNIPNTVDLKQKEQINHHTYTCRQVRRTALHKSYPLADSSDSHLSLNLKKQASSGANSLVLHKCPSHGNPSPTSVGSSPPWATQNSNTPSAGSSLPTQPLPVNSQEAASASCGASQNSEQRKKLKTLHKNDSSDPLSKFCSRVQVSSDEECSICCDKLSAPSNFDDDLNSGDSPHDIKQLEKCRHLFHSLCLTAMYNSGPKDGSLQCPVCKTIHGVKYGTQPSTGTMHVVTSPRPSLPGHPGCGIITITYDFNPGKQGPEHPNPGKHFNARGFPRVCYLPDNSKGQKVLGLLKTAWERRLVFTIGTSNTTGQPDTVVWNEIHHKTEAFSNHSGHGYPDPNYLDNVLAELATHGVEDDS